MDGMSVMIGSSGGWSRIRLLYRGGDGLVTIAVAAPVNDRRGLPSAASLAYGSAMLLHVAPRRIPPWR
jgi:hypothetical protein